MYWFRRTTTYIYSCIIASRIHYVNGLQGDLGTKKPPNTGSFGHLAGIGRLDLQAYIVFQIEQSSTESNLFGRLQPRTLDSVVSSPLEISDGLLGPQSILELLRQGR